MLINEHLAAIRQRGNPMNFSLQVMGVDGKALHVG